jgi:hypothetical protein
MTVHELIGHLKNVEQAWGPDMKVQVINGSADIEKDVAAERHRILSIFVIDDDFILSVVPERKRGSDGRTAGTEKEG